ncbi:MULTISPECIES: hypothetical protein [Streptomyces]|uniref:Integral membrane protein n=1 Tax=Streptomyces mutomycini TaxID=284036 RepID=A0ABW0B2G3_9ACTN|nr:MULTISPECIES: hypothetical protein [Streptomyces]KPC84571.1 hypothetical protein ADK82_00525 [Streptomyces sp. NRRL S-4]
MTTADVFARARMLGWTLLVLPLSFALLRGWAPARVRRRATPRMVRVRGAAGLVLWASAVTSAAFQSSGVLDDGWHPVRILAGPVAVLVAIVLVAVTDVAERRRRGVPLPASQ